MPRHDSFPHILLVFHHYPQMLVSLINISRHDSFQILVQYSRSHFIDTPQRLVVSRQCSRPLISSEYSPECQKSESKRKSRSQGDNKAPN